MEETLIIKNFGPIESVELKLKRFTILIGDQGTGKSTIAKLIIAIQNTIFRENFNLPEDDSTNRETQLFYEYLNFVELYNYAHSNTEINYIHPAYSFELKKEIVTVKLFRQITFEENLSYNFTYIPAERTLITIVAESLFGLTEIGTPLPKLFLRFGNKFNDSRKKQLSFDYTNILGVKYNYKNNYGIVTLKSGKEVNIKQASSGIQGSLPLLIVFDDITGTKNYVNASDIIPYLAIEEPELNLFPETQYKLVSYLSERIAQRKINNEIDYSNQLLITTHSPYILTSLNNLLYAYKVGQDHAEEVKEIVEKKYWLNPNDISSYRLFPNGTARNIFDDELKQIDAGEIDEASRELNSIWDKISDIKFSGVGEN